MSFTCDFCGESQKPGTKPKRMVTKQRMVILEPQQEENPETGMVRAISRHRFEIVETKSACPKCAPIESARKP